jgi:hypothetical protein
VIIITACFPQSNYNLPFLISIWLKKINFIMNNLVGQLTEALGLTLKKTKQRNDSVNTEKKSIMIIHKFK